MNSNPGGKQASMQEGSIHPEGRPQTMVFPANHPILALPGQAQGIGQVLRERGLWQERHSYRHLFLLECPKGDGRAGCNLELEGDYCARTVLSQERDLQEQKGHLQEELEASNQQVIFYPKFHCELNFIERFWCAAKYYTHGNCSYSLNGLQAVLPAALDSVTTPSIHRYFLGHMRVLGGYQRGLQYGTKEFHEAVYKSHRRVEDDSKW